MRAACATTPTWLLLLGAASGLAHADPKYVLRMGTIAPEGTTWAREVRAFSREVEQATHGEVLMKWYTGGIAGNELETMERIRRGQLDGAGSGGPLCTRAAPSSRVFSVIGLFQNRDELAYVQQQLKPTLETEYHNSGFLLLGIGGLGPHVVLSAEPIRSVDDLRHRSLYYWDLEEAGVLQAREMGLRIVPTPVEAAARAFDEHKISGFISIPAAMLGFQWFARTHYLLDLRISFVAGCIVVASRAFDRLPADYQRIVRTASAKVTARLEAVGREQDDQLLGGVFQRQGIISRMASPSERSELLTWARNARERLGARLVPLDLLQRVLVMLADYRADHEGH